MSISIRSKAKIYVLHLYHTVVCQKCREYQDWENTSRERKRRLGRERKSKNVRTLNATQYSFYIEQKKLNGNQYKHVNHFQFRIEIIASSSSVHMRWPHFEKEIAETCTGSNVNWVLSVCASTIFHSMLNHICTPIYLDFLHRVEMREIVRGKQQKERKIGT